MSAYPVRLAQWYPEGDERHGVTKEIVAASKCRQCKRTPTFSRAIGHHCLPYGGGGDVWCSTACFTDYDLPRESEML